MRKIIVTICLIMTMFAVGAKEAVKLPRTIQDQDVYELTESEFKQETKENYCFRGYANPTEINILYNNYPGAYGMLTCILANRAATAKKSVAYFMIDLEDNGAIFITVKGSRVDYMKYTKQISHLK